MTLREEVDKCIPDLTVFIQELVKTPSVNGKNDELQVAKLIDSKSKELGLTSKLVAKDKNRPNIFVGNNFSSNKELLFISHLDTVDVGDLSRWTHKPFGAEIEKGRMFGRGVVDCKTGAALSIYALKILKDLGYKKAAKFVGVVDEESGSNSGLGAKYLLEEGLNARSAIYTYPGFDTVTLGHRGQIKIEVQVKGESVHSGSLSWQKREKGASAIEGLITFINELNKIKMEDTLETFPGYAFVQTPLIITAGSGVGMVPADAKVLVDVRLLPNQDNSVYLQKVEKLIKSLETEKMKYTLNVVSNAPGAVISPNERIVSILEKLDKKVMRVTPEVRGCGPANEGWMFIKAGIPTICGFGAGGSGPHAPDEYLELNTLPKILEMYVKCAIELSK